jgi:transaldolase
MGLIAQIVRIYKNYDFPTQVLVASVRHPIHFVRAAELGAHVVTCPFGVLQQIMKHPLTDVGLERFLADYHKATQR